MKKIKITVIICNYNYSEYIEEAIGSVLDQDFLPAEIIVVDDGSSDKSREILERRYSDNPLIKLLFKKNGGQLSAFAAAAAVANGDVLCFLDADDRYCSGYLKKLAHLYAAEEGVDFIYGNLRFFGEIRDDLWFHPGEPSRYHGFTILETWILGLWRGAPTSALSLRADLGRSLLVVPERFWAEWRTRADDVLVYGAGIFGARKYYFSDVVAEYRVHKKNLWLRSKSSQLHSLDYEYKKRRLIFYFAKERGLSSGDLSLIYREFCVKRSPSRREMLGYVRIVGRCMNRLGLIKSVYFFMRIMFHYWMANFGPRSAPGPSDEIFTFQRKL